MSFDQEKKVQSDHRRSARKPYSKPQVQTVVINSKNEVLGTNCFTSTHTSQQPGNGCRLPTPICFS